MDMTDFEELIDLNIYFLSDSQNSTQGPLNDVLDKMCEAMDERNLAIDNNIKYNGISNNPKDPHENMTDVNELESISVPARLVNDSEDIENKDKINNCSNTNTFEQKKYNNRTKETITNGVIEFESILAATCLKNGYMKDKTNEITTNNENEVNEIVANDEVIDLEEFEDILDTNCFGNDCKEDESANTNDKNGLSQIVSNDDLDELKVILATEYLENSNLEEVVDKTDNTNVTNDEVIDLDEFISQNLYFDKDSTGVENCNSNTTSLEQNYETNNIVPYEVPVKLAVASNNKLVAAEICEEKDINSEDGYNSSDFEFITEDEASKAGLIIKIDKITIDENKYTQNRAVKIPNDNIGISNSRKNEASPLDYIKYSKYRYRRCYAQRSPEQHVIPEGDRYLDMFRGQYAPMVLNNLYSMGNKKCVPCGLMIAGTEDPGAELLFRAPKDHDNFKKYKGDADECLKKILATYPADNKRKKRRY
ncbi:homeobox-like protein HDP1 [Cydia strobilella]|uniref:homeobox-like protein HDP1 n=1 Tax=Cydia strobilella TaxID=1100964 RepID=UPI0030054257